MLLVGPLIDDSLTLAVALINRSRPAVEESRAEAIERNVSNSEMTALTSDRLLAVKDGRALLTDCIALHKDSTAAIACSTSRRNAWSATAAMDF